VPTSSVRRWWIAASTLNVLNVIIAGTWLLTYTPAHRLNPTCETIGEIISYTHKQTDDLNNRFEYPTEGKPQPTEKDLQGWSNGMRHYAEQLKQLTKLDPPDKQLDPTMLTSLIDDSQEVVYLFDYPGDGVPFTGNTPPPLWMKRYNDVADDLEMNLHLLDVHLLDVNCPGGTGNPKYVEPTGTTPTTTPQPAPAAGIAGNTDITDKLLKPSELASIVGDAEMKEVDNYTDLHGIHTQGVDPPDCAARVGVGNTFAYYGSGRAATAGSGTIGARDRVSQLITVWQDREQPRKVVSQSAYEREHYCPFPFTTPASSGDAQIHWVPHRNPATPTSPTNYVTWYYSEDEQPPQTCYHVMDSRANVLVEDITCGDANTDDQANEIANQAHEIANRILNNFPQ
jgi:PknH-like extracellular domain